MTDFEEINNEDFYHVSLNKSMMKASVIGGRPQRPPKAPKERFSELPKASNNLLKETDQPYDVFEMKDIDDEDDDRLVEGRNTHADRDYFGPISIENEANYSQISDLRVGEPRWVDGKSL